MYIDHYLPSKCRPEIETHVIWLQREFFNRKQFKKAQISGVSDTFDYLEVICKRNEHLVVSSIEL